jgi:c-di-GMP-binding flagellar brake protein YcgR
MKERRLHKRTDLVYYLEIEDAGGQKIIGHIGDISDTGLMIVSEQKLPLDVIYPITIKLPRQNAFGKKEISIKVKTKWMKSDFNPQYYCTGCEFLSLNGSDDAIIKRIISSLGFKTIVE